MTDSLTENGRSKSQDEIEKPAYSSSDNSSSENSDVAQLPEKPPYSIYKPWQKKLIVGGAALCAFYNPITAQIYMPALNVLAEEFGVTPAKINLTVTTYLIFQGITPLLFSGFTDTLGRRPGYLIGFCVYIVANIALALSHEYSHVLVIRCFQSAGSATIMVLCQAAIVDVVTSAERGQYIVFTAIPSTLGPSLGPVIGGALIKYMGWRSIFWFLTIMAGVNFVLLATLLPETCRKIVGDGSIRPPIVYRTLLQVINDSRRARAKRPQNMESLDPPPWNKDDGMLKFLTRHLFSSFTLLRDLELCLLLLSGATVFAGIYAISTAAPNIFATAYGLDDFEIGLMYLPMAGGSIVAVLFVGKGMNWNYRRHATRLGLPVDRNKKADLADFPIERVRLEVCIPFLLLGVGVMIAWGWVTEHPKGVSEPCGIIFLVGVCMVGANNAIQSLIVDIFPGHAGAALAGYNLAKCLLGAGASAAIDPMMRAMGSTYAFVVFAVLYLLLVPLSFFIMWRGMAWRKVSSQKSLHSGTAGGNNES